MSNKWDTMRDAYKDAEETITSADFMIADMASMITGRLRNMPKCYKNGKILAKLKRELDGFNITRNWWTR
jgi:hypothetical protein